MSNNTKIILLCGGRGARLGKVTDSLPKPLVKIRGQSIIEHKINNYLKQGYDNYIVCTGYMGEKIEKEFESLGYNAVFSNIGIDAGILKRIHSVIDQVIEPVIISYGDTYAEINFDDLMSKHQKSDCLITLVITSIQHPFGLIELNKNNIVSNFNEKPVLNHYIGYAVFEPSLFNSLPKSIINLPDGSGFVKAIKHFMKLEKVNAYRYGGLQITINTNEDLKAANAKIGNYYTSKD